MVRTQIPEWLGIVLVTRNEFQSETSASAAVIRATLSLICIGLKFIPSESKLFRFIPIYVSEPMRIILNQSQKRFVSCLMENGQKSIRLNPINSETSIRMNPKPSF